MDYFTDGDMNHTVTNIILPLLLPLPLPHSIFPSPIPTHLPGRPHLRYKDVCIRDMKAVDIDTMSWEGLAADRTEWRSALKQHLETGEEKLMAAAADKRARRKEDIVQMPNGHIRLKRVLASL